MATLSAAFTVEGASNPAAHSVAYGQTIDLALTSLTGIVSVQWSIVGKSHASFSSPTITAAGSPLGATASFVFPADPGDLSGRSLLVEALVSDGRNQAVQRALIGVTGASGVIPVAANEQLERDASVGWLAALNQSLGAGTDRAKFWARVTVSGGTPTLVASYNVTSITDTALGALTVTIGVDFANANWVPLVSVERTTTGLGVANLRYPAIRSNTIAAGTVQVECWDGTATTANAVDPASWCVAGYGA